MDTTTIVLLIVAIVAVGAALWMYTQKRRTEELRGRFGPEYDRTVAEAGDRRRAEAELASRRERVEHLNIRALRPEERDRFAEAWRATQARFVDEPAASITAADRLVVEVMRVRGYPVGDFEQRAADISVDHPEVVRNYRAARAIAQSNERGAASTEDLRQAMVHYRALFEELLETEAVKEREVAQ